jgi:hypothetical protein
MYSTQLHGTRAAVPGAGFHGPSQRPSPLLHGYRVPFPKVLQVVGDSDAPQRSAGEAVITASLTVHRPSGMLRQHPGRRGGQQGPLVPHPRPARAPDGRYHQVRRDLCSLIPDLETGFFEIDWMAGT